MLGPGALTYCRLPVHDEDQFRAFIEERQRIVRCRLATSRWVAPADRVDNAFTPVFTAEALNPGEHHGMLS